MSGELEATAADAPSDQGAGPSAPAPTPGDVCRNCDAPLQGKFCHVCGQSADTRHRSIGHLTWELIETLLHLDGRLWRTLPDLFLRPGRLAKDYMQGRIARHVPPLRTFLVALLLFVFAAEQAIHRATAANERQAAARAAVLSTPRGRADEATRLRALAAGDRRDALKAAVDDRAEALSEKTGPPDKIEARYAAATAAAQTQFADAAVEADRIARGLATAPNTQATLKVTTKLSRDNPRAASRWEDRVRKAIANPEYFLSVMFTWGHRLAVLLLPIVGLSLALVYRNRPQFFIYDHLLVALNLLSFAFLTNALGLVLPTVAMGPWLALVALWTPVNLYQTLRGAYRSSRLGAAVKAALVWFTTVVAFGALLIALVFVSLTQL